MMFKQQDVINVDRSEEIYISATEAAALLGVSVQRVYSLVKKNAITFVRYGRKILIRGALIATIIPNFPVLHVLILLLHNQKIIKAVSVSINGIQK